MSEEPIFATDDPAAHQRIELESVGSYRSRREAHEHGLVALSMGHDYWVNPNGEQFTVSVPAEHATSVTREILEYEHERETRIRQLEETRKLPVYPMGGSLSVWYILLLLTGFWFQLRFDPAVVEWGANSAKRFVQDLEWWRPLTALFLHTGWLHLAHNAGAGLLFGLLVAGSLGSLRGWTLILLAGVMGNASTSLLRPIDSVPSIGASTAVFGALGILTAYGVTMAFRMHRFYHYSLVSKLGPLAAGLTLLAMQGMGDGDTDVLAHIMGFSSGILLGTIAGGLHRQKDM